MNSLIEIEKVKSDPRGSTMIQVKAVTLDSYTQQTGACAGNDQDRYRGFGTLGV